MWIINFDFCLIVEKSSDSKVDLIASNVGSQPDFESLNNIQTHEYRKNMTVSLSDQTYYVFYHVLHKNNDNAKIMLFLQHTEKFSAQSSIVLDLFCSAIDRLIETKENLTKNIGNNFP